MRIKIYRYSDGRAREVANGLVDLSYPPKVTQWRTIAEKDEWMPDEFREYVELTLKNDLIPGKIRKRYQYRSSSPSLFIQLGIQKWSLSLYYFLATC
jgi:hypothetical protein